MISIASTGIALIALFLTRQDMNRRERKDQEMFVDKVYEQFQEQKFAMLQDSEALEVLAADLGKDPKMVKTETIASVRINQAYRQFRLYESGFLNDSHWKQFEADTELLLSLPSIQHRWVSIQKYYESAFRKYVNEKISQSSSPLITNPMQLTAVHTTANCEASSCPTIYQTEAGNYVIQGFKVPTNTKDGLAIPESEDAIEVPAEFLRSFIDKMK